MATNLNSQEIRCINWLIANLYMYFVNRLIELCSFFLVRNFIRVRGNFNKVEVVIARLVVRARVNENLSVFIDGNRGHSLASVFVKRAVLIPAWCLL